MSPSIDARQRYRGHGIRDLERATEINEIPRKIQVVKGPVFANEDLDLWEQVILSNRFHQNRAVS